MSATKTAPKLEGQVRELILESVPSGLNEVKSRLKSRPLLRRLRELGSALWLDTGSIDDARRLWTQDFSALTTNNTLLNREVQSGRYNALIRQAAKLLDGYRQLSEPQRMVEIAFILNAAHALKLVNIFDAYVSVEEHTDLADTVDAAVDYARRYHEICPDRFIVKIPFTPAGLLATRKVSAMAIPVNHTLGFSARENYLIAAIAKPAYVNVFLGRLNSFVADNDLGEGRHVGEKATLASQAIVTHLREHDQTNARQIAASFREGRQVHDLAGVDVMTMPPEVAAEFLSIDLSPEKIADCTGTNYTPGIAEGVDTEAIRFDTLWRVEEKLTKCVDKLERENLDNFTPDDLIDFFQKHDCADVLPRWRRSQIAVSMHDGRIPQLHHWRRDLEEKSVGLDSVMNLAGLSSFTTDQKAMDKRVEEVLNA